MVEVGKVNCLEVVRSTDFGLILNGDRLGDILLPNRYLAKEWMIGDRIDVFLMVDSEDRLTATTERPVAMVGDFAYLPVASVTKIGAFLRWGLPKDLFVPFREQKVEMFEGESYVVRIYLDEMSGRIAASSKLDRFLDRIPPVYKPSEKVKLMICDRTDLGFKAIVNGRHWGMLFYNEVFQVLHRGQFVDGFVKQVRPDGKIDLCLQKPGFEKVTNLTDVILNYLKAQGGFMAITDKSEPETIYRLFGVSKKTYKQAIGGLYKKRLITFENNGTKLVRQGE
ncbi:MAG: GntR family transcriptional regulator [Kiritimatiellaceae bacterium]|nr:GntR family transcriptional regulator [Kiritimatiellaceae bacterium]